MTRRLALCQSPWLIEIVQDGAQSRIELSHLPSKRQAPFAYPIPEKDAAAIVDNSGDGPKKPSHKREIERKFLPAYLPELDQYDSKRIDQGYLCEGPWIARARIKGSGAFLTLKGNGSQTEPGCDEFEYPIPLTDSEFMIENAPFNKLQKIRYEIPFGRHVWELDLFQGKLAGLALAEVELASAGETPLIPPWVGQEVTGEAAYYNKNLAALDAWVPPSQGPKP